MRGFKFKCSHPYQVSYPMEPILALAALAVMVTAGLLGFTLYDFLHRLWTHHD